MLQVGWFIQTAKSNLTHRMLTTDMKEMDCVEITVNKEKYTREGVYKGMQGWICHDECANGYWLVNLPQYGAKPDIATISIHESDMIVVPVMDARINEKIKAATKGKN